MKKIEERAINKREEKQRGGEINMNRSLGISVKLLHRDLEVVHAPLRTIARTKSKEGEGCSCGQFGIGKSGLQELQCCKHPTKLLSSNIDLNGRGCGEMPTPTSTNDLMRKSSVDGL